MTAICQEGGDKMDRAVAVTVRRRCRTVECEGVYFIFTCDLRSHTDLDMPMLLPVKTHVVCWEQNQISRQSNESTRRLQSSTVPNCRLYQILCAAPDWY